MNPISIERIEQARECHREATRERIRRTAMLASAKARRQGLEREFGADLSGLVAAAERLSARGPALAKASDGRALRRVAEELLTEARAAYGEKVLEQIRRLQDFPSAGAERAPPMPVSRTDNTNVVMAAERLLAAADALVAGVRELPAATAALEAARGAERLAAEELGQSLGQLPEPGEAIDGLDPRFPILLFPVRLETRFIRFTEPLDRPDLPPKLGELRVRIYPDAIAADLHEPLLTPNELEAGRGYWRTAWRSGRQEDAWAALVAEVGAPRAAWLVQQCEPANVGDLPASPAAAEVAPAPEFPPRESRPPNWHRAPQARLLPDRWVVEAIPRVGGVTTEERARYRITSRPVREPLALTLGFDTDRVSAERLGDGVGPPVDPELRWTFDFERAEEVGMAVRIPLEARDFQDGLVRVSALGVKTSLSPAASARELESLIASHRHSRGFAFVQQGTPTNNTLGAGSGYPPEDPRGIASFRVERGPSLARADGDGARFMTALGLPVAAAEHVAGADRDEQRGARAMAVALWSVTIGYYLRQMLASAPDVPTQPGDLSAETIEAVRRHFLEFVRGRGPYPAFRIGSVPYGLLPVSTLAQTPEPATGGALTVEERLPLIVAELARTLSSLAERYAPHLGGSGNPGADLVNVFRMDASAREVYIRPAVGEETLGNMGGYAGGDVERFHEPISLDQPIRMGGPGDPPPDALNLRSLLGFAASEPDQVADQTTAARDPTGAA